jgi:hypothetical protein
MATLGGIKKTDFCDSVALLYLSRSLSRVNHTTEPWRTASPTLNGCKWQARPQVCRFFLFCFSSTQISPLFLVYFLFCFVFIVFYFQIALTRMYVCFAMQTRNSKIYQLKKFLQFRLKIGNNR